MSVIDDTKPVDSDQGRTGPRQAQDDQAQFTPGYIEERTTLAGVALLGTAVISDNRTSTNPTHRMPRWTLEVDDTVYQCPDESPPAGFVRSSSNCNLSHRKTRGENGFGWHTKQFEDIVKGGT